jgi:hypothetical protein
MALATNKNKTNLKWMSNHDWETMVVILVRSLTTKPLIFKQELALGRACRHEQGRVAQPVEKNIDYRNIRSMVLNM